MNRFLREKLIVAPLVEAIKIFSEEYLLLGYDAV
jgi:hypothetical protein